MYFHTWQDGAGRGVPDVGDVPPKNEIRISILEKSENRISENSRPGKIGKEKLRSQKVPDVPPFFRFKNFKIPKIRKISKYRNLQKLYTLKKGLYLIMAKSVTPTKVHPYEKDTPKEYEKHPGRVRGWVPEGSPYAEHPKKKR